MIRMGRSSKTEQTNDAAYQPKQTTDSNSLYPTGNTASNRAVSESESMARDIKEGRLSGFIGSGTVLTGETTFQAILRIDGHLTGRVLSEDGTLIVGSTGRVDANIHVAAATINGTVNGDVVATERLELGRTAHVVGNVQTPRLLMEDGAILEGGCSMMKARETMEKRIVEANTPKFTDEPATFQQNEPNDYLELNDDEKAQGAAN
ncbi:MAG: polymer-forming cytoskeletal protein [Acidobacteriota bacterium]|nr:polymer-forming cytoskeletal protein [Acidobacteriota bacterium]